MTDNRELRSTAWAKPNDPGGYLAHQLMLVQTGRKNRAPGIRRCADCAQPFIDDHTGLGHCATCRVTHRRHRADCRQPFLNTPAGDRLCASCRNQLALSLFDTGDRP